MVDYKIDEEKRTRPIGSKGQHAFVSYHSLFGRT